MALDTNLAEAAVNAYADAIGALLDDGYLRIYSGAMPAGADDSTGGAVLLAELRFANPAFHAAASGVAFAYPLTAEDSAPASGTATWARCLKSDGSTKVMDCTVGASGANVNLNTTAVVAGNYLAVNQFSFTAPKT